MPRNPAVRDKSPEQVKSGYSETVYEDLCAVANARNRSPSDLQRHATLRMLYGMVGPAGVPRQQITWPKLGPTLPSAELHLAPDTVQALQQQAAQRGMTVLAYMGHVLTLAMHGAFRRPAARPEDFSDSMLKAFVGSSFDEQQWR
jgi:hypothetical protein